MYNIKKHKITLNTALIGFIIFSLLTIAVYWNNAIVTGVNTAYGFFILFAVLALACGLVMFFTAYRFADQQRLDAYTENIQKVERLRLIKENEKTTKEEKAEEEQIDIKALAESIMPDMRGIKNTETFSDKLLSNISSKVEIVIGLCYVLEKKSFVLSGKYAITGEISLKEFKSADSLPGQAIKNKEIIVVDDIPENYFSIESGLGKSAPRHLIFVPVIFENEPIALMELSTFKPLDKVQLNLFNELKNNYLGDRFAKLIKK